MSNNKTQHIAPPIYVLYPVDHPKFGIEFFYTVTRETNPKTYNLLLENKLYCFKFDFKKQKLLYVTSYNEFDAAYKLAGYSMWREKQRYKMNT